jgi:hypothetical protein
MKCDCGHDEWEHNFGWLGCRACNYSCKQYKLKEGNRKTKCPKCGYFLTFSQFTELCTRCKYSKQLGCEEENEK